MSSNFYVNQRDFEFILFEQLKIQELEKTSKYGDFGQDMYGMMIGEAVKFLTDAIAPLNQDADRIGAVFAEGEVTTPPGFKDAWEKCRQNGWISASMSPQYGGMGLPGVMGTVLTELFLGACTSFQLNMGLTTGVGHLIETFGTDEQKSAYVEKLYAGQWAGTMVLTEAGAGSALGDCRATATKVEGEDYYQIEGTKCFITAGDHDLTENIIHAVLAKLPNGPGGVKDLGLFIVPKFRINDDGSVGERNDVLCTGIEHKMGIHGSPTCSLSFGEDGQCRGWLLGPNEFQGMRIMFQMMNEARVMTGLQGVALAGAAYENAVRYARERKQGPSVTSKERNSPSVPIIQHGDVRRMLLLQRAHVEGMRAFAHSVAYMHDQAITCEDEGKAGELESRMALLTPLIKAFCSDKGFEMCSEAIQVYGGYGYCGEYPVEQYTRDARIAALYEGTNFIQSADLIGRKLRINGGATYQALLEEIGAWVQGQAGNEELSVIVKRLGEAHGALGGSTLELMKSAGEGDFSFPLTVSTRFLHMFAEVMVGWTLGQQALLAQEKLAAGASGDDKSFYEAKILTARFFAANVLPGVRMKAAVIKGHDTTALDFPEDSF